jgi:hypothetical protein
LNDENRAPSTTIAEALRNYDIVPVIWSARDSVRQELADELAGPGSAARVKMTPSDMVPAGYMAKRVVARPDWLPAERVSSI